MFLEEISSTARCWVMGTALFLLWTNSAFLAVSSFTIRRGDIFLLSAKQLISLEGDSQSASLETGITKGNQIHAEHNGIHYWQIVEQALQNCGVWRTVAEIHFRFDFGRSLCLFRLGWSTSARRICVLFCARAYVRCSSFVHDLLLWQ